MRFQSFTAEPAGDRGIFVRFPGRPTRELSATLISMANEARSIPGVLDAIPGHRTIVVETAPGKVPSVLTKLRALKPGSHLADGSTHTISVRYDGPDMEWASQFLGIDAAEIIRMHAATTFDVRLIGSPGFVYLSQAPAQLHMPRRDTPRVSVPAGSVGIGGRQAGIYARSMPGGWRILGTAEDLPELRPGDRVRFVPE